MAITYEAIDVIEPASDVDIEQAANQQLYGVIHGCAVTYDAADMTYDVAAGTILHNGSVVQVSAQANAGTLVSDGSNLRWATIYLDSTGVEGVVHGTAGSDPAKPEHGDNVPIAMVRIEAAQTVANNITYKPTKQIATRVGPYLVGIDTTERTTTSTSATDLVTISGLNITVDQPVLITGVFGKQATSANAVSLGLTINATSIVIPAASAAAIATTSATQQIENGEFSIWIAPRSANYLTGIRSSYHTRVSTGAAQTAPTWGITGNLVATLPNATITSIIIRGQNHTSSNTLAVKDVRVYAG